jgi:hypothetical protein
MIGDSIKLLPSNIVQGAGLGALWLLYRYVANINLKQFESYLFEAPDKYDYESLAVNMTQAHCEDEGRHYTTSFDLGL